jgi:hypothetical protein
VVGRTPVGTRRAVRPKLQRVTPQQREGACGIVHAHALTAATLCSIPTFDPAPFGSVHGDQG